MNLRIEPRFKTEADVTVRILGDQDSHIPGRIVDVSGTGFQLFLKQALTAEKHVRIDTGAYRLLDTVRYCAPAENGYAVGVERIDDWLLEKQATPSEEPYEDEAISVLGRPRLKADLGPVRTIALRGLFTKQSGAKRRPGLVAGVIAMAVGAGILAVVFGGMLGNAHRAAPPSAPVVSTPGGESQPLETPAALPPQPTPLQVTLHATSLSWVDACADGKRIFSKGFAAGETGKISFSKVATIRSGNAGALAVAFGPNPAERMGNTGNIRMWKFTAEGHQDVPPNSANACAGP